MPQFRADYDVKGGLVLPIESAPVLVRSECPAFEMTFRNAEPDESGHVPNLVVQVVAESNSIDHVADQFRSLLAKQLDLLGFVTHSTFMIGQCRRVLEWEHFLRKIERLGRDKNLIRTTRRVPICRKPFSTRPRPS
jgi:hypothetical protein